MNIYIVKQDVIDDNLTDDLGVEIGAYLTYEDAVEAIKKYDPLSIGADSIKYRLINHANGFVKTGYSSAPAKCCVIVYVNREPLIVGGPLT